MATTTKPERIEYEEIPLNATVKPGNYRFTTELKHHGKTKLYRFINRITDGKEKR